MPLLTELTVFALPWLQIFCSYGAARQAPAAHIGPTQYSQMIWAVVLGYVLFGDGVDLPMVAGIVLIVASGLLTLIRERVRGTPLPPSVGGERHVAAALVPAAGNPGH